MLLKCPSCGSHIRMSTPQFTDKKVRYLCQECEQIVSLDLVVDEIPTSSSAERAEPGAHTQRILVVDDTAEFLNIAADLLMNTGYTVSTARDGAEALRQVADERPDAIVLDLYMPKMSGFEVLRTLRTNAGYKNFRSIPVLVTSVSYNPAEMQLLHDLGANGFITKEAMGEFLIYRVRRLLPRTTQLA